MAERKSFPFRMDEGVEEKMDILVKDLSYNSKNELLNNLVLDAYYKFHEDPKMADLLKSIKVITSSFENLHSQLDALGVPRK